LTLIGMIHVDNFDHVDHLYRVTNSTFLVPFFIMVGT
jgi:hypothetical protein